MPAQTPLSATSITSPPIRNLRAADVEKSYLDIVRAVKSTVTIPVAVKVSPFFSNFANMAQRLDEAGADGLVLFNRFYQPDIDLEELEIRPNVLLSSQQALRLPLDVDRNSVWARESEPGRYQRRPYRRGHRKAAHGRSECDDALLIVDAARHQSPAASRPRTARVDGRARIRISTADARQHEPATLLRPRRLRTCAVYARSQRHESYPHGRMALSGE